MDEEIELELEEDEVDLDELMDEYEKAKKDDEMKENLAKVEAMEQKLAEANKKVAAMESKLRETNLFNAKLLYANRLLKEHSLTKEEKDKMLSKLDKAKNVNEVKLVYEVVNEGYTSNKQNIQESLGFASKPVSSTSAPQKETILNESITDRFKILANIK